MTIIRLILAIILLALLLALMGCIGIFLYSLYLQGGIIVVGIALFVIAVMALSLRNRPGGPPPPFLPPDGAL